MPVLGSSEVQKTLKGVISKQSKKQTRQNTAPCSLNSAPAPRSSALLGVLFQQSIPTQLAEASIQQKVSPSQVQEYNAPSQPTACTIGRQHTAKPVSVTQSTLAHAPEHALSHSSSISHAAKRKHIASTAPTKHQHRSHPSGKRVALQHQHVRGAILVLHNNSLLRTLPDVPFESSILHMSGGNNMYSQPLSDAASRKREHTEPFASGQRSVCDDSNRALEGGSTAAAGISAACSGSSQQSKGARQAAHGTSGTTRFRWQQRERAQQQPAGRRPSVSSQQGSCLRQALHAQGKPALPPFHRQQQEQSQQQPAGGVPGCRRHASMQGKRPAKVQVFGAALSNGRKQPRLERAPGAAGARQDQRFNHFENGHGFWDGDMAGLDGLESVGLDCWEGCGTVSMGRL